MTEATRRSANQTQQRRSRRSTTALVVIVALALGAIGGAIAASQTGEPAGAAGSAEPPELPAEFPAAGEIYLPEVAVSAIESWITDNEYECEVLTEDQFEGRGSPRGAEHWLHCSAPSGFGSGRAEVEVEYDDETEVLAVEALCERGPNTPEEYCPSLFSATASTVFDGQPDVQEEAVSWAEENIDDDAIIDIGGIQLETNLGENTLTLVRGQG